MLSPKIADLIGKIEQLPLHQQEELAEDIAVDLADAQFAAKLASGIPMPAFEALVAQAEEEIAHGKYRDLDELLVDEQ